MMLSTSRSLLAAVSFLGALTTVQAAQTSFQITGKTLVLGNVSYFVPPTPVSQLKIGGNTRLLSALASTAAEFSGEIIPLTVIPTSDKTFGQAQLEDTVASYEAQDDVFSTSFLKGKRSIPLSREVNLTLFSCLYSVHGQRQRQTHRGFTAGGPGLWHFSCA